MVDVINSIILPGLVILTVLLIVFFMFSLIVKRLADWICGVIPFLKPAYDLYWKQSRNMRFVILIVIMLLIFVGSIIAAMLMLSFLFAQFF